MTKATNGHSGEERGGGAQVYEGEGRAVNAGISGGHLCTRECLNSSALDTGRPKGQFSYVNTRQLPSLCSSWARAETSHCLNSAQSIPLPGPRPAACILTAGRPEQTQIRAARAQKGPSRADEGAPTDISTRNAPEP